MKRNKTKDTVAVLMHIPIDLYEGYLTSLVTRGLKRQTYNPKLFCKAIELDIKQFKNVEG